MIRNKKILTIVIPIYNVDKYLINCLESIGEINIEEVEVILINDGSTDKSEEICKEYSKKFNYTYIYQKNKGCSSARNLGIETSNGEYIWFIDSDDCVNKNAVSIILKNLKLRRIELLNFGMSIVDRDKNIIEEIVPKLEYKKEEFYNERGEILNGPCNKIYNLDIIKKYKIKFPENSHLGEDLVFNFKYLSKINNILTIQDKLYYYYQRGEGVTSNLERQLDIFLSFDDILIFLGKDFARERIFQNHFKRNCIDFLYSSIIRSNLSFSEKIQRVKKIEKEVKIRKNIIGTDFKFRRYQMKWKLLRREIKNIFKKGKNI